MKQELVGETLTVNAPAEAIAALAYESAAGMAAAAELEFEDADQFASALDDAASALGAEADAEAQVRLVENGIDVVLQTVGGTPGATIEYRA